jgi:hypothetical protein
MQQQEPRAQRHSLRGGASFARGGAHESRRAVGPTRPAASPHGPSVGGQPTADPQRHLPEHGSASRTGSPAASLEALVRPLVREVAGQPSSDGASPPRRTRRTPTWSCPPVEGRRYAAAEFIRAITAQPARCRGAGWRDSPPRLALLNLALDRGALGRARAADDLAHDRGRDAVLLGEGGDFLLVVLGGGGGARAAVTRLGVLLCTTRWSFRRAGWDGAWTGRRRGFRCLIGLAVRPPWGGAGNGTTRSGRSEDRARAGRDPRRGNAAPRRLSPLDPVGGARTDHGSTAATDADRSMPPTAPLHRAAPHKKQVRPRGLPTLLRASATPRHRVNGASMHGGGRGDVPIDAPRAGARRRRFRPLSLIAA